MACRSSRTISWLSPSVRWSAKRDGVARSAGGWPGARLARDPGGGPLTSGLLPQPPVKLPRLLFSETHGTAALSASSRGQQAHLKRRGQLLPAGLLISRSQTGSTSRLEQMIAPGDVTGETHDEGRLASLPKLKHLQGLVRIFRTGVSSEFPARPAPAIGTLGAVCCWT